MLGYKAWGGSNRRPAVERLLFLNVLLREPVERRSGEVLSQNGVDRFAKPEHPGSEVLNHDRGAEPIHHQAAEAVGFRMDNTVSIGHVVQLQQVASEYKRVGNSLFEEGFVDPLLAVSSKDSEGDAGVAVVETAAAPVARPVLNVYDRAVRHAAARLLHHLLENPWVARAAVNLQPDRRQCVGHAFPGTETRRPNGSDTVRIVRRTRGGRTDYWPRAMR